MRIKNGVRFHSPGDAMLIATLVIQEIFREMDKECEITGGIEDPNGLRVGRKSYHPVGGALDFKVRHLENYRRRWLFEEARGRLGDGFDVVLEDDHLHVEYDPKD